MAECDLKCIGKRINKTRKKSGYTQEQLAEKMNVSVQMISNLERGIKSIRIENLINLCQILDVSTDYILLGKTGFQENKNAGIQLEKLNPTNREMIQMIIDFCLEHE